MLDGWQNNTAGPDSRNPLRVLVVDDEPIIHGLLGAMLANLEVGVEFAVNGIEAQKKLSSGSFQLVITDINMPEMDGISLMRWLKKTHPAVDVVLITGFELTEDMTKTIEDTTVGYFTKPLDPKQIKNAVENCREKIKRHTIP